MAMMPSNLELSPLPAFVLELIRSPRPRTSRVVPMRRPRRVDSHVSSYARAALDHEIQEVRDVATGERNDALNRAAFSLGQLAGGNALPRALVEQELRAAAEANGLVRDDGEASVEATIRSGVDAGERSPRQSPPPTGPGATTGKRPEIKITTKIREVVDASLEALVENAPGQIYAKASILVRVTRQGKDVAGYKRAPEAPLINPLPEPRLLELMASAADWLKFKDEGWEPALPPRWAVQVLGARGRWPFPYLESVSETPTLRPDGTVIQRPGYDEATGTLFIPSGTFPPVPEEPTREDATQALAELFEPFAEFPFKTMADASVLLAAPITIMARPAIAGPTPLFAIRKNAPGVGGSLAVDAISVIATGRPAPRMTLTSDSRELRKLILTLAIEGTPLVLFDNLEGTVGSSILAAAITSETWADRLLGVSKVVRAPLRPTWLATGNGLTFTSDLGRRVMLCDMFTDLEHPEDRSNFKHADLLAHVTEIRPRLVVAVLTILRAYCVAGRPPHGRSRKGGFVSWDELVRGALVWAKADDPMDTTKRLRAEADTDLDGLRSALRTWRQAFHDPVTAGHAIERARAGDKELLSALAILCDCSTDKLDSRSLGYTLRRYRDRPVGGLKFVRPESDSDNTGLWTVEVV